MPKNTLDVILGQSVTAPGAVLSTHVDGIQAILLTLMEHPEAKIFIKGRCIDAPGQIMEIVKDDIYELMTKFRANNRGRVFDVASELFGERIETVGIRVENINERDFPCKYYSSDQLVKEWIAGKITANHLMPVFGGATIQTIGSNVASLTELQAIGQEMSEEITQRQIGGVPLLGQS